MYFNILVGEEKRGRVSNHDDFMKLLKPEETKKIFEADIISTIIWQSKRQDVLACFYERCVI